MNILRAGFPSKDLWLDRNQSFMQFHRESLLPITEASEYIVMEIGSV